MKIYLASPYTHPDIRRQITRYHDACSAVAWIVDQGLIVFSPIVNMHPIAHKHGLRGDFEYWKSLNLSFLEWADELWILCIDGWESSIGILAEIKHATLNKMPVFKKVFASDGSLKTL